MADPLTTRPTLHREEPAVLVRHWRRRARIAQLADRPLQVTAADVDELLSLQVVPPVVVVRADGMTAFKAEVDIVDLAVRRSLARERLADSGG